jgi:hypothetical protein
VVAPGATGSTTLTGEISINNNLDVFDLGPFQAGDRMIVDVATHGSGLDPDAAIFDAEQRLTDENDDRNPDANQLDPSLNQIIRHDSSHYFLAIAASPFADATMQAGTYEAIVTITRGGRVPTLTGQLVALNTGGGSVVISGETFTAPAFDTADIDPRYAGQTARVLNQIIATIQANYAGLELQILVVPRDQAQVPPGCSTSRILLGGLSSTAFGLSQDIDHYNADHCDESIIFTRTFQPSLFGRVLTATQLGTAIGHVTSHEVGHLLGLSHVDNIVDIMDTTGTPDTFLLDQEFRTSPLDASIFPIGDQDGLLLLQETLSLLP